MQFNWHNRFLQQATWTQDLRYYLYHRAGLDNARRILEVGCGTGVILAEMTQRAHAKVVGLDLDPERLKLSAQHAPEARLIQADGQRLPFEDSSFDMAVCHFLLLWAKDPLQIVREMSRVTREGGSVLALAEPDYGGRIDYPETLSFIGKWQQQSLKDQGGDTLIGRKLKGIFHQAGIKDIEAGVLGAQWSEIPSRKEIDLEWDVLRADLGNTFPKEAVEKIHSQDINSWECGERILFVPTFYAWGRA
jgi:ubiquinone/menaquinone biosynthesis C-methylase UbiE